MQLCVELYELIIIVMWKLVILDDLMQPCFLKAKVWKAILTRELGASFSLSTEIMIDFEKLLMHA